MRLRLIVRGLPRARVYSTMAPVNVKVAANDFLDFVNASPTPYHAVKSIKERLTSVGFKEIKVSLLGYSSSCLTNTGAGEGLMVVEMSSGR